MFKNLFRTALLTQRSSSFMVPNQAMRNMMTINQTRLMTQQMGMMSMLQRAQFSTANAPKIQIKVIKNTVTSEIGVLEQQLPKAPAPELFFP
jgi:hypothetical protein